MDSYIDLSFATTFDDVVRQSSRSPQILRICFDLSRRVWRHFLERYSWHRIVRAQLYNVDKSIHAREVQWFVNSLSLPESFSLDDAVIYIKSACNLRTVELKVDSKIDELLYDAIDTSPFLKHLSIDKCPEHYFERFIKIEYLNEAYPIISTLIINNICTGAFSSVTFH